MQEPGNPEDPTPGDAQTPRRRPRAGGVSRPRVAAAFDARQLLYTSEQGSSVTADNARAALTLPFCRNYSGIMLFDN